MIQIKHIIISLILTFSIINLANASLIDDTKNEILKTISANDSKSIITRADSFNFFSEHYLNDLPKSYKYINLNFKDVKQWTEIYESLQKLVYIDVIWNKSVYIHSKKSISSYNFYFLSEKILWTKIIDTNEINKLKNSYANLIDLYVIKQLIENQKNTENQSNTASPVESNQKAIFDDVYNTLRNDHYNKENISVTDMMYWAIEWLATGTKDKFTTYFPPLEKKKFSETLSWEYEGIWAYVDMIKPGELKIISPLSGSPAEKAWLKAQDSVIKIDNFEITKDTSLDEAVAKIKWPAGTDVTLTIKRWVDTLTIKVTRAKVILKDVEWKSLSDDTYYMNIRIFWDHLISDFKTSLSELKTKTNTKKLIIDLRNNPGWYLDWVSDLLSYFIEVWNPVAVVKYKNFSQSYNSKWYTDYDFSKLKIVILINGWTASASEIMAWTLKDYYPNITLIWEKTYGKGSVQTIKTYFDWSSLKYTIAHWFTWKNEIWINWTWIKPDIELILDTEKLKNWVDNQLEAAKNL